MTDLPHRATRGSRRPAPAPAVRPMPVGAVPAAGILAALSAAGLGLLTVTVAVLVGWAGATHTDASGGAALRTSLQAWLLAHHGGLRIPGGHLGLMPLGLTALPGAFLALAAARAARAVGVRDLRTAGQLYLALVAAYATATVLVAPLAATEDIRPLVSQAFVGAALLALVAGGAGVLRGAGLGGQAWALLPERLRALLAGAAVAVLTLVAAGALLVGAALAVRLERAGTLADSLHAGAVGSLLLWLVGVALVPNAALWGASYAIGPGFAVGVGTTVGPFAVHLGAVPALPMLAALPQGGAVAGVAVPVLLAPYVAGALAGTLTVRRLPGRPDRVQVAWAGGAGVVAGLALGGLAALSGGPVGGGRLAAVGPSPWQVGLLAAAELGLAAALTAWALPQRLRG